MWIPSTSGNFAGSSVPVNAIAVAGFGAACGAAESPRLHGAAAPPWLALAAGCAAGAFAAGAAVDVVDVDAGGHGVVLAVLGSFFLPKTEPRFLNAVFALSAAPATVFGFAGVLVVVLAVVVDADPVPQGYVWFCAAAAEQNVKPIQRAAGKIRNDEDLTETRISDSEFEQDSRAGRWLMPNWRRQKERRCILVPVRFSNLKSRHLLVKQQIVIDKRFHSISTVLTRGITQGQV